MDRLATMFSLVTYDAFQTSRNFKRIRFVKFFFDDGRAYVDWRNVDGTLQCINSCLNKVGLKLNLLKTIVYTKNKNKKKF